MELEENHNEQYFTSYEDLEVHQLMLEDQPRTLAYKLALFSNKSYFKDKVVMDVGCGTGILSIFCAQAGAKKVYAVEASKLANLAKEIVEENHYENVIEVIHSRVEDVVLPDDIKVDAIVSEWMGFYLLHEAMLDSVLVARDRFLKEDGQMFPESAVIYVAPCSLPNLYDKWEYVHGVKMTRFGHHLRKSKYNKPEIAKVRPEDLLGNEVAMCWIDLKSDKKEDLDSFSIQHAVGANSQGYYQGICVWFECLFPNLTQDEAPVTLATGPLNQQTHWKQTVIVLPQKRRVEKGEPIAFQLDIKRDPEYCRRYNLQVTLLDPEVVEHPVPCSCHMTKCIIIKTYITDHPEQQREDSRIPDQGVIVEDAIDDDDDG